MLQVVEEQMGQVEGPKVVDAEGDLEVFLCAVIRRDEHTGVVDQDVQRQLATFVLVSEVVNGAAYT